MGIELHQSDQKGLLDNVASVLLFETVLPRGPANKRKEISPVELVEPGGIGQQPSGTEDRLGSYSISFASHKRPRREFEPIGILSRAEVLFWEIVGKPGREIPETTRRFDAIRSLGDTSGLGGGRQDPSSDAVPTP